MLIKDREQLRRWLVSGASLAQVEEASRWGVVENERFTEQARRAFRLLWTWSAPRFSYPAARLQDRAHARLGEAGLQRRYARAQKLSRRLTADAA